MKQSRPLYREKPTDVRKWEEHTSNEMVKGTSLFLSLAVSHLKDAPRVPLKPKRPPLTPPSGNAGAAATAPPPGP